MAASLIRTSSNSAEVETPTQARPSLPEFELKFPFPLSRTAAIHHALRNLCIPDPRFPESEVESLYFDTRELALLAEAVGGNRLKTKVRLRWYPSETVSQEGRPAWLEIKNRDGRSRTKDRLRLVLERHFAEEADGLMAAAQHIGPQLREFIPHLAPRLLPMLTISYRRRRFIEPESGARIAIDSEIRGTDWNRSQLRRIRDPKLGEGVVEIKGFGRDLPTRLGLLRDLGCHAGSFSKYALCHRCFNPRSGLL